MKSTEVKEPNNYTVNSFLSKIGIAEQHKILKKVDALVRIQGTVVGKINTYKNSIYFNLASGDAQISVHSPIEHPVNLGEHIVVEGFPVIRVSKFNAGLDVILEGVPIGTWIPRETVDKSIDTLKSSYIRLEDFLNNQGGLDGLFILGTETAITDVTSNIGGSSISDKIISKVIRVSNEKDMINDIDKSINSKCKAIALVRGGDDKTLNLWDNHNLVNYLLELKLPFYLAVGHSHRVTLSSQYADESFHTPSALGKYISDIFDRMHLLKDKNKKISACNKEISNLEKKIVLINNKRPLKEWFVIIILSIVVTYLLFF